MIRDLTFAKISMWWTSKDNKIVYSYSPEEVSEQYIVDLDRVKFIGFDDETNMPRYMIMPLILSEPYVPPVTSYEPPLIGEELKIDQVD